MRCSKCKKTWCWSCGGAHEEHTFTDQCTKFSANKGEIIKDAANLAAAKLKIFTGHMDRFQYHGGYAKKANDKKLELIKIQKILTDRKSLSLKDVEFLTDSLLHLKKTRQILKYAYFSSTSGQRR